MKRSFSSFENFADEWNTFRQAPSSVLKLLLPYAKGNVLDAGCGNGRNTLALAEKATRAWGVDVSSAMLSWAQRNAAGKPIVFQQANFIDLPFKDHFFDAVFCLAAFHHVLPDNQVLVLQEFKRVLKRRGFLCLTVWNRYQKRFRNKPKELNVPWRGKDRYYYFFDEDELKRIVIKTGFKIVYLFYEKDCAIASPSRAANLCLIAQA